MGRIVERWKCAILLARLSDADARIRAAHVDRARERAAIEAKYPDLIGELDQRRVAIQTTMDVENKRMAEPTLPSKIPVLPLQEFLITNLHARGPMTKDELREAAERAGYFEQGDGGRAVSVTLSARPMGLPQFLPVRERRSTTRFNAANAGLRNALCGGLNGRSDVC